MKIDRTIGILKYLIVCLVFVFFDRAEEISSAGCIDYAHKSEFSIPTQNHVQPDKFSFSSPETQCRVPRQSNVTNTLRTSSQAQRQNTVNQSRNGFTLVKAGKSINEYTTSLFHKSIINFPSGLSKSNHHLIGLRKLII